MNECFGAKFILNGELLEAGVFNNSMVYEGDSIYEVIRLVKGVPVFFHDHMERLNTSVKLLKKQHLADAFDLRKSIMGLVKSEGRKNTNLKIVFNYNNGSNNYLVYFIEPLYPSVDQYEKGVKGILYFAERKDPESKVINHKLRSSIYHKLIHEGGYEALLVNEDNLITEGSRSNIFFMTGDTLITAPDNVVLNGITRKYIIDICSENNIKVVFRCVSVEEVSGFEAVFMTGTSPKVLPFCCIDKFRFHVKDPLIEKLRQLYMVKVQNSIQLFMTE